MAYNLKKTIVLVGMMGAGKTAVGNALARQIGAMFCDSDDEIVRAANMSIPEIFARDGEDFFRQREAEVLARLMTAEPCILSTGGGAFLSEKNRATIGQFGLSVWLKADLELLWARVRHRHSRPLLQTSDPKGALTEMYMAREIKYRLADLVVASDQNYSVDEMAAKVRDALLTRPEVLEVCE